MSTSITVAIKTEYKLHCRQCDFKANIEGSQAAQQKAAQHVHGSPERSHEVEITIATIISR